MRYKNYFQVIIIFLIVIVPGFYSLHSQVISKEVPDFSVKRGFYVTSFDVVVSSETENTSIRYTLDGSDPKSSTTSITKISPVTIHIDPESTDGQRGKTPGVVLRACTIFAADSISETVTNTYLFINKVVSLSPEGVKPGTNWPNPGSSVNSQEIDYGISPVVANDPRYKNIIDDALLSIPTISIVTDLKNLFSPSTGIFVNAMSDGPNWERPVSVELLNPDSSKGFHINAGLRIRGGWSRHPENPKHAFRLFFRDEYGEGKLEYPLFGNEGVDIFDKVDLRTSQNYAWSYPGHQGEYNIMVRDVFSRDMQREMGQPYTRSRFYHLYINGAYWGIYQTQERPEARFAASYMGGNIEDYDVIKNDSESGTAATDGNMNAYTEVWNLCKSGFSANANYFKLQGLNVDGSINPAYKNLVDVDNLIDYMMIIFYAGNFDSPTSKFGGDQWPNNFYCIYNRVRKDGFKFFIHDAEHTLRTTAGEGPGIGLYENRVSLNMSAGSISQFHPQWLHYKLTSNAEYKIRFADHVYKRFFNEGCLTNEKATKLFQSRTKEIEMAIIGESARWGNTYSDPPRNKDNDWLPAVNDIINNYFPYRGNIVLGQLKNAGLYPNITPPTFAHNGIIVQKNIIEANAGYILKLANSNSTTGSIKYTIDGSDPRIIGGGVSTSAFDGEDEKDITINSSTIVKARILNGTTWSALHEINLFIDSDPSDIKITEIHYHPVDNDTINDDEYEFLELKNTGNASVNLSEAYFEDGILFTFPEGAMLNANSFIVLASNRDEFIKRYGFTPYGEYSGQLDNGGERITLNSAVGDTIFSIKYDDVSPWPEEPDGSGVSLVTKEVNPTGDLNDPASWRASLEVNGSPGKDDVLTSIDDKFTGVPFSFKLEQNYPNPFNPETNFRFSISKSGLVTLKVYDILGNEVATLVNENKPVGAYTITYSASNLASGIYFYRLTSSDGIATRKMVLLK